jgi:hypothetical protein
MAFSLYKSNVLPKVIAQIISDYFGETKEFYVNQKNNTLKRIQSHPFFDEKEEKFDPRFHQPLHPQYLLEAWLERHPPQLSSCEHKSRLFKACYMCERKVCYDLCIIHQSTSVCKPCYSEINTFKFGEINPLHSPFSERRISFLFETTHLESYSIFFLCCMLRKKRKDKEKSIFKDRPTRMRWKHLEQTLEKQEEEEERKIHQRKIQREIDMEIRRERERNNGFYFHPIKKRFVSDPRGWH